MNKFGIRNWRRVIWSLFRNLMQKKHLPHVVIFIMTLETFQCVEVICEIKPLDEAAFDLTLVHASKLG